MTKPAATTLMSQLMLGAGLLAFVYVLLTPRLVPDIFPWPDTVSNTTIGAMRWLVGIVLGAIVMTVWLVLRGIVGRSRTAD